MKGGAPAQLRCRLQRAPVGAAGGPAAADRRPARPVRTPTSVPGRSTSHRAESTRRPLGQQGGDIGRPAERIGSASSSGPVAAASAPRPAVPARRVGPGRSPRSATVRVGPADGPAQAPRQHPVGAGSHRRRAGHPADRPARSRVRGSAVSGFCSSDPAPVPIRRARAHVPASVGAFEQELAGPGGFRGARHPSGARRPAAPARPWSARRTAAGVPRSVAAARTRPHGRPARRRGPSGCRPAGSVSCGRSSRSPRISGGSWAASPSQVLPRVIGKTPSVRCGTATISHSSPLAACTVSTCTRPEAGRHLARGQAVLPLGGGVQVVEQFPRPGTGGRHLGDHLGERVQVRPAGGRRPSWTSMSRPVARSRSAIRSGSGWPSRARSRRSWAANRVNRRWPSGE